MRQPTQFTSGFIVHAVAVLVLAVFVASPQLPPPPAQPIKQLVWTKRPGQNGGGDGGDRRQASPARPQPPARPFERFTLPIIPASLGAVELPGVMTTLSAAGFDGTGRDDGTENGKGPGDGGPGSGLGTGPGAGPGDNVFEAGLPGVVSPQVLVEQRPEYTLEAMRAKVQGPVLLEATVLPDGSVGAVKVVRSLEPSFGLEQKAIEAVRAWKFRPGSYHGKPVAVRVLVELSFRLR